ncbi:MAG: response regulator [Fuerstiella sp.]|nr:response regulator [Fuerstiella sp.]MCP4506333.1 response regulator [Fuerstiella sp.]
MMEPQNQNPKLLLVDDDPNMIRLLTSVISCTADVDFDVESLTDPVCARNRIEEGGVDILVTDLEMPAVNGLELLRCAKRRNAATQVLFMTGHSTQEALLSALEHGASDYLLKPVNQLELLSLLRHAYERQQRWKKALLGTWRGRHVTMPE